MLHTVLWGIVILILVIWLLGLFFRLAGGIIRILIAGKALPIKRMYTVPKSNQILTYGTMYSICM